MPKFYTERDADLRDLEGKTVAVVGYGNQGRAHALNLRDSGVRVVVGQRKGPGFRQAAEDGFEPMPVARAVRLADLVAFLVPDEVMADVYRRHVAPGLEPGNALLFAHGFAVRFGLVVPPDDVDVVMVSPKGPGRHVRSEFEAGRGLASLVAVHHDASGHALALALAYAKAIGGLRACCLRTTFAEETEADLFGEQVVLCGGVSALVKAAFDTLVRAGCQPEIAYFEVMHELSLIVELLAEGGLTHMRRRISNTAEYGDLTRGPRLVSATVRREMKKILREVRDGSFAREWTREFRSGLRRFKKLQAADEGLLLERVGRNLRRRMRKGGSSPAPGA